MPSGMSLIKFQKQGSFLGTPHSPDSRLSQFSSQFSNFLKGIAQKSEKNMIKFGKKPLKRGNFYNVISSFYLCRKFINNLMKLTAFRQPKWLTAYHFDIMNDRVFFYKQYRREIIDSRLPAVYNRKRLYSQIMESSKIQRIYSICYDFPMKLTVFLSKCKVLFGCFSRHHHFFDKYMKIYDPTKTFTIIWDFIIMLVILFYFIIIPLEITFSLISLMEPLEIVKQIGMFFLMIDIIKTFNTAYYHKGILVINRREILSKYIYHNFPLDVITIIPVVLNYYCINDGKFEFFNLFFFIKYSHFKRILQRFQELIFVDQNLVSLIKLVFRMLFFAHIFACFWYYIGTFSEDSWLKKANLLNSSWTNQYLVSFYFIIVTMNTVGFGDITPINSIEIAFIILLILIGCGLFAVNINSIGLILSNLSRRSNDCSKELNIINQFMLEKDINFELRMRIRKYLQYIWNEEKLEEIEQQTHVVSKLSDSLKEELLLEANGPYIRDIKLLNLNFTEETLRQTVAIMKEVRYTPGDMIFFQNDIENKDLYIIRKGEVELFMESHPLIVMKKLGPGEIFGELSFFSNKERTCCARSLDFTNIFIIHQKDFLNIIQKNNKDIEKFCQIQDHINIYGDYGDLYNHCFSCQESDHQLINCPLIHYIPKKEIILLKYLYTQKQVRQDFKRKWRKDLNAFKVLAKVEAGANKFQQNIFPSHETLTDDEDMNENEKNENFKKTEKTEKTENFDKNENSYKTEISEKKVNFGKNGDSEELESIEKIEKNKKIDKLLNNLDFLAKINEPDSSLPFIRMKTNGINCKSKSLETIQDIPSFTEKVEDDDNNIMNEKQDFKKRILRKHKRKQKYLKQKSLPMSNSQRSNNHNENTPRNKRYNMASKTDFKTLTTMKNSTMLKSIDNKSMKSYNLKEKISILKPKIIDNNENIKENRNFSENFKCKEVLEMETVKSFEVYFPHNNIERVLARIEYLKLSEILRKGKKNCNRKKYQLFLENNMNINEVKPNFLFGSLLANNTENAENYLEEKFDKEMKKILIEQKTGGGLQRKFFKDRANIERLIREEEFDPEKLKERYKEKYQKKEKNFFCFWMWKKFKKCLFKKAEIKKKILVLRRNSENVKI